MRGRYPDGPELLDAFDASAEDKERVQRIMATVFGQERVHETCERLDVGETRFRQLRDLMLQGALDAIKARPSGRPSRQALAAAERVAELEQALAEKELELQQALVRTEVALILRQRTESATTKKGRPSNVKLRKRKPR